MDGWHCKDTRAIRQHNATINYDTVCHRHCRRRLYCMGSDCITAVFIQIFINILCNGIRQPPFAEDSHNNQPEKFGVNGGEKGEVVRPSGRGRFIVLVTNIWKRYIK